jgi:hypothetical protein
VPGTAAEILDDDVRWVLTGTPSAERLATARSDEGRRRLTLSITPT